jgi:catechol 2,3-dioxygenase-like lactoylglutathione lyase family enzyme
MINGGNATLYVSNMDTAIRFYTEVLGLKLTNRFGNHWATVQAGTTLVIGLHPWSEKYPRPGTRGAVQIGLVLSRDEAIEDLAARLRTHGVEVSAVIESQEANYISFTDPDGNPIYVGDWDPAIARDAEVEQTVESTVR